jgi:ketosteroid isomerase-like protein
MQTMGGINMRALVLGGLLTLCCGVSLAASAQETVRGTVDDSLHLVFEGRYAAMKAAMAARDGRAISKMLAPDFVSEDASGQKENANEMIQEVISLPKDPEKKSKTTILSVKTNQNGAVVDQRYNMKTTKSAPDGSKRDVELIAVSTDRWIKSKDRWLLQRTVTNQMDYIVDGKQVIHQVRPSGQ